VSTKKWSSTAKEESLLWQVNIGLNLSTPQSVGEFWCRLNRADLLTAGSWVVPV